VVRRDSLGGVPWIGSSHGREKHDPSSVDNPILMGMSGSTSWHTANRFLGLSPREKEPPFIAFEPWVSRLLTRTRARAYTHPSRLDDNDREEFVYKTTGCHVSVWMRALLDDEEVN